MKKNNIFNIILICIVVFSIIACCKAVYEDEDFIFDILGNINNLTFYVEYFICILLCFGILYGYGSNLFSAQPVISYLARREKSPPNNF